MSAITSHQMIDESRYNAEFACARCWKQRKKCDRVRPKCSRCEVRGAGCSYSPLPPKESLISVEMQPRSALVSGLPHYNKCASWNALHVDYSSLASQISVTDILARTASVSSTQRTHSDTITYEAFGSQIFQTLRLIGDDMEPTCKEYFQRIHCWVPFIDQMEFWRRFSSLQINLDLEFSILLVGIYINAYTPTGSSHNIILVDSTYSIIKNIWSSLQMNKCPSILLIQAGLLLATYEHGQALKEISTLTIRTCVEMGHTLKLDHSLEANMTVELDQCREVAISRRLWWAVVIFERLLAAEEIEEGCSFVARNPSLDDLLPECCDNYSTSSPFSQVLGVAQHLNSGVLYLSFDDARPYAALAQATYLLSRVNIFIKGDNLKYNAEDEEASYLDELLRRFAYSILRQAEGTSMTGSYCSAFFTTIISLAALHRYHLAGRKDTQAKRYTDSQARSLLAIETLQRMYIERSTYPFSENINQIPSFEIYPVYIGVVLHIKVGDRSSKPQWETDFQKMVAFIQLFERKWKIASVYLDSIHTMLETQEIVLSGGIRT